MKRLNRDHQGKLFFWYLQEIKMCKTQYDIHTTNPENKTDSDVERTIFYLQVNYKLVYCHVYSSNIHIFRGNTPPKGKHTNLKVAPV